MTSFPDPPAKFFFRSRGHAFPETSFLVTPDQLRQLLKETGFEISSWEDTTAAAEEWFASLARNIQQSGLPPLGFHVLLGPDFQVMARNQRRNLEEGRIVLAQVVARKRQTPNYPP